MKNKLPPLVIGREYLAYIEEFGKGLLGEGRTFSSKPLTSKPLYCYLCRDITRMPDSVVSIGEGKGVFRFGIHDGCLESLKTRVKAYK